MADREGNPGAPKVDEREVRTGRGPGYTPLEEERGTSWVSVVLGWLAALGAGLILSGIGNGKVGAIFGTAGRHGRQDRKSTRLHSRHANSSDAVFCLKKKTTGYRRT